MELGEYKEIKIEKKIKHNNHKDYDNKNNHQNQQTLDYLLKSTQQSQIKHTNKSANFPGYHDKHLNN